MKVNGTKRSHVENDVCRDSQEPVVAPVAPAATGGLTKNQAVVLQCYSATQYGQTPWYSGSQKCDDGNKVVTGLEIPIDLPHSAHNCCPLLPGTWFNIDPTQKSEIKN